jgi:hypothetical protein
MFEMEKIFYFLGIIFNGFNSFAKLYKHMQFASVFYSFENARLSSKNINYYYYYYFHIFRGVNIKKN